MSETTNKGARPAGAILAAVLLALLAACTEPQAVGECEPGVAELSEAATVVPGSC